ncbi:hypothetical protein CDA63_03455 [Hymenobacter amundsenii]|uniref:Uncharacterized protein n=1 Tax=Hymenobacter amundsenii TaxID=2006685 RepID=A0A246FRP8_9BACT|nr:hypothetical protein [Hymenobacter amundsenii]OWP64444.1 hypothetical protein CDA63_03455 [Hymenobacter amundsenii]
MTKLPVYYLWLAIVLLAGCQSTRPAPFFFASASSNYQPRLPQPASARPEAAPARLTASRPDPAAEAALPLPPLPQARPLLHSSPHLTAPPLRGPAVAVAPPDTVVARVASPAVGADPLTTVVNVGGALAVIGGGALIIAAANYDGSGYAGLGQLLLALPLLAVGIPLLFFQGKNGRRRLRREGRDKSVGPLAAPTPKTDAANKPLQKLGLGMLLAAGAVLLLGLLGGVYGLAFASFIGGPLAVLGIILFIAGS